MSQSSGASPPPPGWCWAQWGRWYIQINFWRIVSNLPWYIQITPGQVRFIQFLGCTTWYHNFDPFHRVWGTCWGSFRGVWISYWMALYYMYVQLDLRHTLKQFSHMLQTMSVVWYLVDSPRSRTMIDPSARVVGYCADRIITNYHGGRSSRAIIGRRAISTSLQASIALRCGYHCNHYNSNHHFIAHHTWCSR